MSENPQLLQQFAQTGDQTAFAELVRQHVDLVYSAALRQVGGDDHLARDVSQGVFTALARSAPRLARHPSLTGWLYTTTHHLAAKAVREHSRWRGREQKAYAMQIETLAGPAEPNWEQLRPVLDRAMHQLSAADREALLLRFFENLPFAAVGARSNLSENSARMRVERALAKLRTLLAKQGITSTAAALGAALTTSAVAAAPAGLAAAASTAALASLAAGGASAGTVSFLLTMSTTKTTVGIVSALLLVAAGTATYEAVTARHLQAQLDLVHKADSSRINHLEAQVAALTGYAAAGRGRAAATGSASTTNAANAGGPRSNFSAAMQLLSDPNVELTAKIQLASLYAPLLAALHLQPDQIDQFKNLLVEKRAAAIDAMAAASENGVDPATNPGGFYQAVVAAEAPINQSIAALLGPAGAAQYVQYSQGLPAATTAHQVQQALSYTDSPLSDAQTNQVSQILKENSPAPVPEPFAVLNLDLGVTTFTPQAQAQLAGILSAPQIAALEQQIASQNLLLQSRMKVR